MDFWTYGFELCAEAEIDHLSERSIDEVYYLWRLAGGDLKSALKKEGLIKSAPPVNKLCKLVVATALKSLSTIVSNIWSVFP